MASVADMLIQQGFKQTGTPSGLETGAQGITQGAQLAQHIEQVQAQRQQMEQAKQQLMLSKVEKYGNLLTTASKLDPGPARNNLLNNYLPNFKKAMGIDDLIPEPSQKVLESQPALAPYLISKVQANEVTYPELIAHMQDPEWLIAKLPETDRFLAQENLGNTVTDYGKKLQEAEKFRLDKIEANKRAEMMAQPRTGQLEARKDEQAAQAVQRIHNDQVLKPLTQQANNVSKGLDLLSGSKPPSVTAINEVAQDFSAALSGKGISSDFKLKEINPQTIAAERKKLEAYITSNPDQPAPPEVIKFWKDFGTRLNGAYTRQVAARASLLGQEAKTTYQSNPAAVKAVQGVVKSYKTGEWSGAPATFEVQGRRLTKDQLQSVLSKNPEFRSLVPPQVLKDAGL